MIIGIAVTCVVLLVCICVVAWFFLAYKKKKNDKHFRIHIGPGIKISTDTAPFTSLATISSFNNIAPSSASNAQTSEIKEREGNVEHVQKTLERIRASRPLKNCGSGADISSSKNISTPLPLEMKRAFEQRVETVHVQKTLQPIPASASLISGSGGGNIVSTTPTNMHPQPPPEIKPDTQSNRNAENVQRTLERIRASASLQTGNSGGGTVSTLPRNQSSQLPSEIKPFAQQRGNVRLAQTTIRDNRRPAFSTSGNGVISHTPTNVRISSSEFRSAGRGRDVVTIQNNMEQVGASTTRQNGQSRRPPVAANAQRLQYTRNNFENNVQRNENGNGSRPRIRGPPIRAQQLARQRIIQAGARGSQ